MKLLTPTEFRVGNINKIKKLADADRSASKPVTFALQYLGTEKTLMNNSGFSREKAMRTYEAFKKLYADYFTYLNERLSEASRQGYVLLANGVRLDTPALYKGLHGTSVTSSVVDAEYRSAGNAISQSYGSLNTVAALKFQERVWNSEFKYDIWVVGLIHDAIYVSSPNTPEAIQWVNKHLIECMVDISDYPELHHPVVHLEAELDLHESSWMNSKTIPNNTT